MDFDAYERRSWAGQAEAFHRTFAALCAHPGPALLDAAGVPASGAAGLRAIDAGGLPASGPGLRVLDAGTGTGTLAALAVERGATVTAVDAEPSMVEAAAARVPDAEVRTAVLPALPFADGSFDAVVANFVLNHVADPAASLAELRRVTRPGGRLAVTIWPYPTPELQALCGRAVAAAGIRPGTDAPRLAADRDFTRDEAGLGGLLRAAGLADVDATTLTWHHHTTLADWWAGPTAGIGAVGHLITAQPQTTIELIREHYVRLAAPYRTSADELVVPTAAVLASATLPR